MFQWCKRFALYCQIGNGRQDCSDWRTTRGASGRHLEMVHVNRKVSSAIFEITWGKAIPRSTFAASSAGLFRSKWWDRLWGNGKSQNEGDKGVYLPRRSWFLQEKSHAITGEIFAHMMFWMYFVTRFSIGGGDAKPAILSKGRQAIERLL